MTKQVKIGLIFLLALGFLFTVQNADAQNTKKLKQTEIVETADNAVLVQLTNGVITQKDVDLRTKKLHPMYQSRFKTVEGQKQVIEAILQEELFYHEAIEQGYQNRPDVIANVKAAQKPIVNELFFQEEIVNKLTVNAKEVSQFYETNKAQFIIPPSITIKHLQVKNSEDADEVQNLLDKGESFDELIENYSTNRYSKEKQGIIANIRNNDYITGIGKDHELDELIYAAPIGDKIYSAHTETGYHFFQKIEHIKERYKELEEVKNDISNQLKQKKEKDYYDNLIAQLIKANDIEIDYDYIKDTNFLAIHPDEFNRIVITSNNPELVYNTRRIFLLIKDRYQMEKMNVENPTVRKKAIEDDLYGNLIYTYAENNGFIDLIANNQEMIQMKKTVILRSLHQVVISDIPEITDEDLQEYYNTHKDSYKEREYRQIRQFTFKTEKQAKKILKKANKLVKKGKEDNLIELLRKESFNIDKDGLLTPVYDNGIMPTYGNYPEYNKLAIEIKDGEISSIFKNPRGEYVFFYLVKVVPERQKDLDEVKVSIESNYKRRKSTELFKSKLEEYRQKYVVSEHFERLQTKISANELFDLAETAQKQNSHRDAVHFYDQIINEFKNGVDDYKAWFMKAFVYSENMNKKDEAIILYQEMIQRWPQGDLNDSALFMIETLTSGEENTLKFME